MGCVQDRPWRPTTVERRTPRRTRFRADPLLAARAACSGGQGWICRRHCSSTDGERKVTKCSYDGVGYAPLHRVVLFGECRTAATRSPWERTVVFRIRLRLAMTPRCDCRRKYLKIPLQGAHVVRPIGSRICTPWVASCGGHGVERSGKTDPASPSNMVGGARRCCPCRIATHCESRNWGYC